MATAFMLEYVRNNFFLPGQIENWIMMIDFAKMSVMNIPYKVILQFCFNIRQSMGAIMGTLQSQYRCTSAKIFIVNATTTFSMAWSTVKNFLEEHTKAKITIIKQNTCDELKSFVHPSQLYVAYGGEMLDNVAISWPPKI
jgi:hypothetical protein